MPLSQVSYGVGPLGKGTNDARGAKNVGSLSS